ncbi:MAG: hypothetical protein KAT79_00530 [candidate division Zixibacteria bacterium]|nr:hypothetical protein [candidate division Zixibacteria bacterium]
MYSRTNILKDLRYSAAALLIAIVTIGIPASTEPYPQTGKDRDTEHSAYVARDCMRIHNINNLQFGVSNFGRIGTGMKPFTDCHTGAAVPRAEFPRGSNTVHLYNAALWVGAVVGRDTLVTCGAEFNTTALEMHSDQPFIHRSTLDQNAPEAWDAISEQDFISVYTDTFTSGVRYPSWDPVARRGHRPLNLEITQRSFAWSYEYASDFALIEFTIKNIGDDKLKDAYVGIYVDADVHKAGTNITGVPPEPGTKGITEGKDDLTGYIETYPSNHLICDRLDTVAIAWTADNNGDFTSSAGMVVPGMIGFKFLGDALDLRRLSYNWWAWNYSARYDYGPQLRENATVLGHGLGTPYGDINKYRLMSNGEVDFDQAFCASFDATNRTWVIPQTYGSAWRMATGADAMYVISVGPYDISPGASITVPIAVVAGENFHSDHLNHLRNLKNTYRPDLFMANSDISDLIENTLTATRIYDNPGIDTDGDGYYGKFHICNLDSVLTDHGWVISSADTLFYEGDGVPDFRGAGPPPAPSITVNPVVNGLRVRFNGYFSETTRDIFSGKIDFEGYRIYIGRDDRESSYAQVASYDRENYDKMVYVADAEPSPRFELREEPLTAEELRCLYGRGADPCADARVDVGAYSAADPYVHPQFPESLYYFVPHDFNASELGVTSPIRKLYPHEAEPDLSMAAKPEQLTDEGYLKYYEYEVLIEGLLPTVPYHVAVTAFDFGMPSSGLAPLESSKALNTVAEYPASSEANLIGASLDVYVYPNPYRIDESYRARGFEGIKQEHMPDYRVRQITFANLPPKCTIRIHSIDGDLIREMSHDYQLDQPGSGHHVWDLVTRNRQMLVSGLYYWCVEDENGQTQIGKLVILF